MVMKSGKLKFFVVSLFLLAILGVIDPAQTWQNTKAVMCAHTTNQ